MIFNVSELESQDNYRLLTGGITPRPIAWISTRSKEGVDNLAPYSFFSVASCNPPVLLYTQVTQRSGVDKDTLQNLIETGECVVNIVNSSLLEKMSLTSASLDQNESEFSFAEVESCSSSRAEPLSVKESTVRYECTLREVVPISNLPASGTVVFLDVQCIYVQGGLYEKSSSQISQQLTDSVGKLGGDFYSFTTNKIELERP